MCSTDLHLARRDARLPTLQHHDSEWLLQDLKQQDVMENVVGAETEAAVKQNIL